MVGFGARVVRPPSLQRGAGLDSPAAHAKSGFAFSGSTNWDPDAGRVDSSMFANFPEMHATCFRGDLFVTRHEAMVGSSTSVASQVLTFVDGLEWLRLVRPFPEAVVGSSATVVRRGCH